MAASEKDGDVLARPPRQRNVKAVLHAVDLLEALASAGHPVGVTELARTVGLSKASVFNLLATLESRRLVTQQPGTSRYRLDWGLHELASAVARDVELVHEGHGCVTDLAERVGETVLLGVARNDAVVYVDKAESSRHRVRMFVEVGSTSPLHSTATGKVLLAFADDEVARRVLRHRLEARTPATITDPRRLRAELEKVRADGYGIAVEENESGLCSVAVPIRDHTQAVVAALTLASPKDRFDESVHLLLLPQLRVAAAELSRRLGGSSQSA